jgi:hypothetical protein
MPVKDSVADRHDSGACPKQKLLLTFFQQEILNTKTAVST